MKKEIKAQRIIDLCVRIDVISICFYYENKKQLLHLSNINARLANVLIEISTGKICFENYLGGNVSSKLIKIEDETILRKRFSKEGESLDEIILWILKKCIEGVEIQCIENENFYIDKFVNDLSKKNLGYFNDGISIGLLGKSFGMAGGDLIRTIKSETVYIDIKDNGSFTQMQFDF